MVGEHEPADTVVRLDVRRPAREGDLDRCGTPGNEIRQLPFPNPQEGLVDLMEAQRCERTVSNGRAYLCVRTSVGSTSPWMIFRMEM